MLQSERETFLRIAAASALVGMVLLFVYAAALFLVGAVMRLSGVALVVVSVPVFSAIGMLFCAYQVDLEHIRGRFAEDNRWLGLSCGCLMATVVGIVFGTWAVILGVV